MNEQSSNTQSVSLDSTASSHYMTGLKPGRTYEFVIFVSNDNGDGPLSDPPVNATLESSRTYLESASFSFIEIVYVFFL